MSSSDLAGAIALVTGATSGIGRAAAMALADRGAHVIVSGRDAVRGGDAVATIHGRGGAADFVAADLDRPVDVRDLAGRALELGEGRVDILVNNAGVFPTGPTAAVTGDEIDSVFGVNVRAPFLLVGELAPRMAERGHGVVVNVLSMVARFGLAGFSLYGSSKAALALLTKAWAAEFGPSGVRVNAVSPGPTRTEGTAIFGDGVEQLAAPAPAGRPAEPGEIAFAIAYLASNDASFVQGSILDVDGGRYAT